MTSLRRLADDVFADANSADSLVAFRRSLAMHAMAFVGAEAAVVHAIRPSQDACPAAVNFHPQGWDQFLRERSRYFDSAMPLYALLIDRGRPIIDTDFLSSAALRRLPVYAEVILPAGLTTILAVPLGFRGASSGMLAVARGGTGARFDARDGARMREAMALLGIADAAVRARCGAREPADLASLGLREREVAHLLATGLQNKEIAALLGTSVHTVHNQARQIYAKLGVSGRACLAARFAAGVSRDWSKA